jgi:excinuclease ABC subunit A
MVEHNLDVIAASDHIIDLGPEGGANGGRIVAQGTPDEVGSTRESYTGRYLARLFPKLQPSSEADFGEP